MDFIVGTFNHQALYTIHFDPPTASSAASLSIIRSHPALSGHSWLSFSPNKKTLYASAWTKPKPSVAAYQVKSGGRELRFLNAKNVQSLSGYVCASARHVYSVGGPSGEVFYIESDGSLGDLVQELDFVTGAGENVSEKKDREEGSSRESFGGLRHGAHSVDISPDGKSLFIPDIGRNCIWTYRISDKGYDLLKPPLELGMKCVSPREHDGPRHSWPHPNGKVLYCLQEHSSMVDAFAIAEDGVTVRHTQGVRILPHGKSETDFWADEVRLSTGPDVKKPRYLYASTRGLKPETKGYVAVFALDGDGSFASEQAIHIWETPTSGGLANAIEPAPWVKGQGDVEYLAMTDSEEGWVFVLSFDGKEVAEVSRVNLGETDSGEIVAAATAVWLGLGGGNFEMMKSF